MEKNHPKQQKAHKKFAEREKRIMKHQNQVRVFISIFLALLSVQGAAVTEAAATEVSQPASATEQVEEPLAETTSEQDKITIENGIQIPNITVGESVSIRGTLYSASSSFTMITIGVYNSEHQMITGKTAYPMATSYDVSRLAEQIRFSDLAAGTYTYEITVSNGTHTNYTVVDQEFTVSAGNVTVDDSIAITDNPTIPNIMVGKAVSIQGTVSSASSNITKITVGVFDENNVIVTGDSVSPNLKTYDVANLDAFVMFGNLKAGTYYYKVLVTNATHTDYEVVNQKFTVSESNSTTAEDKIQVSNGTTIPNITAGTSVSIRGTVTSATSNITRLTIGIYREDGTIVSGRTVVPDAKTYDIAAIDAYIPFGTLPAGTYFYKVIATNATHTNHTVVNQKFTVSNGNASTDTISITGGVTVPNIEAGNVFSIHGTVTSASSDLKSVTVGVYDSNGKWMTGKTVSPNAKTYDIANVDEAVTFGTLPVGTYFYKVIATNATHTNHTVVNQKFTVSNGNASTDTISVTGGVTVPNIEAGNIFSIHGTVTSASSDLKSVTVGVYDSNGKWMTGKTVSPNAKTYDIANVDEAVTFGTLPVGTYFYKVIATNATHTNHTVVNQKFTVSNGNASTDTISVTGGVTVPNIEAGNIFSIHGTVTSASSDLKSVTVGVYDSNGKWMTGKTVSPNAKTYDIANVDEAVTFGTLPVGTYFYKVIATNATHTNDTVVNQKFTVSDGNASATDTISVTGGVTVPNIEAGNIFSIHGTVTSASSDLKSVTVGVYDSNGKWMTGKTVSPNAKTYDIANVDEAVTFGTLPVGTYFYKVIATNATHTNDTVVNQKFTVSNGNASTDTISITGGVTVPNIEAGNVFSIHGTVTSASSHLKSVTVGVYDSNGKWMTGKMVSPNAKTYDIANVDEAVSFGTLPVGTYFYKVIATNATHTNDTVVNQKFTVSNGNASTDTISITGGVTVPNIEAGNVFSIHGTVTSASSDLKSVTVGVYDSNGKWMTGKTVSPNAKIYDIANVDAAVRFDNLKAGTYSYKVIASNTVNANSVVVNQKFTVSESATSNISITGGTTVPNITEGTPVIVKGTVSSTSHIYSVTVGVYSTSGNLITGRTVNPNTKSYDLRNLDAYVNFDLLTPDNYLYRVTVSDGTKNQQLVNQAFQVKAKGGSSQSQDRLTLSGGRTIPNIKVGKAVSIRGTIKSATSNITSLTVGVFTSSGNLVTGKTVRPNAKSYDIRQVDMYVNFNLLSPDTYYYSVIATNGSYQNQVISYQQFTVTQ